MKIEPGENQKIILLSEMSHNYLYAPFYLLLYREAILFWFAICQGMTFPSVTLSWIINYEWACIRVTF